MLIIQERSLSANELKNHKLKHTGEKPFQLLQWPEVPHAFITFGLDYFINDQLFPTDDQTLQHDFYVVDHH